MQFDYNDDYPKGAPSKNFTTFDNPHIDPCRRYDTNILFSGTVYLGRIIEPTTPSLRTDSSTVTTEAVLSDSSDDEDDDDNGDNMDVSSDPMPRTQPEPSEFAYWIHRSIGTTHFGCVYSGMIIKRLRQKVQIDGGNSVSWEGTGQLVAIKEYSIDKMRSQRLGAENPFYEIATMQYLFRYHQHMFNQLAHGHGANVGQRLDEAFFNFAVESSKQAHVMLPIGAYSNHSCIYTIMPYLSGGDLFASLGDRQRFSEPEARYWMHEIIKGLETLQKAGVCHRDLKLENILTDTEGNGLIIDMGMSIKIPYLDDDNTNGNFNNHQYIYMDHRQRQRCLINCAGRCGTVSFASIF